jgi:hypothetical protein
MKKNALRFALLLLTTASAAQAQMVAIDWDSADRFRSAAPIRAGKVLEACAALGAGESVAWTFDSHAPLDFNIHYHDAKKVVYPVEPSALARASGMLVAPVRQDYCWMWTNPNAADSDLVFTLHRIRR